MMFHIMYVQYAEEYRNGYFNLAMAMPVAAEQHNVTPTLRLYTYGTECMWAIFRAICRVSPD